MRTLTLTLTLKTDDAALDLLTGDQLSERLKRAIETAWAEVTLEVIADAYEPTVPL